MNPIQESKQELEAAIRYAENAIASANQTIESIATSQEQTGRELALEAEVARLKAEVDKARLDKVCAPTMPVIPKAVAIAIFREGVQHGVEAACTELEGQTIMVEESEYVHNFEVSFTKEIDLEDELNLDWMRSEVGRDDDADVIEALKNLCATEKFECRIHGVDDQQEKQDTE